MKQPIRSSEIILQVDVWWSNHCKGPRYCPSLKIRLFDLSIDHGTRAAEPEGPILNESTSTASTSLPEEAQDEMLRTIPGLENVRVIQYGYGKRLRQPTRFATQYGT